MEGLEIEPVSVRLDPPLETARGQIATREGFLVSIEYEGTVGVGEATPLRGWTESYDECHTALERAGQIAAELDWGMALAKLGAPAARHGIALALAEARAIANEEPLYRTLGGEEIGVVRRVPVNATVGAHTTPEETVETAQASVLAGFDCIKLKVGLRPVEDDVERVRALREEVGDDVSIRVDANGAWTREQAETAIAALAELDVEYVEQPLPTVELGATAGLVDNGVDIALDESMVAHDVETIIDARAADVLILKPMVLGGPDLTAVAAATAREAGIDPVISTTVDPVVARTGAVHVAASIPDIRHCGLATADRIQRDIAPDPAPVSNGTIQVPQEPGLGFRERP